MVSLLLVQCNGLAPFLSSSRQCHQSSTRIRNRGMVPSEGLNLGRRAPPVLGPRPAGMTTAAVSYAHGAQSTCFNLRSRPRKLCAWAFGALCAERELHRDLSAG